MKSIDNVIVTRCIIQRQLRKLQEFIIVFVHISHIFLGFLYIFHMWNFKEDSEFGIPNTEKIELLLFYLRG